jgi:uncharacterized protein (UPF0179 family)
MKLSRAEQAVLKYLVGGAKVEGLMHVYLGTFHECTQQQAKEVCSRLVERRLIAILEVSGQRCWALTDIGVNEVKMNA